MCCWSELHGAQFSVQLGIGWFIFFNFFLQACNLCFQAFLIQMVYDAVVTNNPQGLN